MVSHISIIIVPNNAPMLPAMHTHDFCQLERILEIPSLKINFRHPPIQSNQETLWTKMHTNTSN